MPARLLPLASDTPETYALNSYLRGNWPEPVTGPLRIKVQGGQPPRLLLRPVGSLNPHHHQLDVTAVILQLALTFLPERPPDLVLPGTKSVYLFTIPRREADNLRFNSRHIFLVRTRPEPGTDVLNPVTLPMFDHQTRPVNESGKTSAVLVLKPMYAKNMVSSDADVIWSVECLLPLFREWAEAMLSFVFTVQSPDSSRSYRICLY